MTRRRCFRRTVCRAFPMAVSLLLLNAAVILFFPVSYHLKHEESMCKEMPKETRAAMKDTDLTVPLQSEDQVPATLPKDLPILRDEAEKGSQLVTMTRNISDVQVFTNWTPGISVFKDENHPFISRMLKFNRIAMIMDGHVPKNPVELVIGIPTVKRTSKNYMSLTVQKLVEYLGQDERKDCHIVVLSASSDTWQNQKVADFIKKQFKNEVETGLIEVIKPDLSFYPKLTGLPSLWKDTPERVKWRSKQCIDYALLFAYCRSLGKYYLQLEDDVSVDEHYFKQIKLFIQARGPSKWSNLQFGSGGFIGMLYRASDLDRLALFVKMYYWIYPVDMLFRQFNDIHLYGNSDLDVRKPPLFRHLGAESSLKGQTRKV